MNRVGNESIRATSISIKKRIIFLGIYFVLLTILSYIGWLAYRTTQLYNYVKESPQAWKGRVYQYDPDFGLVLIPGGEGAEVFRIGPEIPMKADINGFRVPVNDPALTLPLKRPVVMALGCSFTYGQGVLAEETFPYLVGRELNGTTINAAVCAHGLSQMLIIARRLIPKYKPDYVLVQYSPWLARRSLKYFFPLVYRNVPTPFFTNTKDNSITIHPPVFKTEYFDWPVVDYYWTKAGISDFASFLINIGFPFFIYDDFNMLGFHLKKLAGVIPEPARNSQEDIERIVYGEIEEICRNNGAKMLLITWGAGSSEKEPSYLYLGAIELNLRETVIVNAYSVLYNNLQDRYPGNYLSVYGNYRGSPPVLVDTHPNSYAHAIIASEIVRTIETLR